MQMSKIDNQREQEDAAAVSRLQTAQLAIAALIVNDRLTTFRSTWTLLAQEIERRTDRNGARLVEQAKAILAGASAAPIPLAALPSPPPKSPPSSETNGQPMTADDPAHPAHMLMTAGVMMTEEQAANLLGVNKTSLQQDRYWARKGNKPPRLAFSQATKGGEVRYAKTDVLKARMAGTFRSTSATSSAS